jgi:hypothetical protein
MTAAEIEKLAEIVRQEHKLRVPVDLTKLCAEEGIELAPGDYPGKFHGRIEFLSEEGVFAIFHPAQTGVSEGRIRFTIAHELGHYFIEEHRDLIVAGNVHNSVESFAPVRNRIEREADAFAACLLMPEKKVAELAGAKGYLDAGGVRRLAEECKVGLRAAAFRYSELAEEPCWLIFANAGEIECAFRSEEANTLGFGGLGVREIPSDSAAHRCISGEPFANEGKGTDTTKWFSPRMAFANLWEDSIRLGSGTRTLTLLSWADYKAE